MVDHASPPEIEWLRHIEVNGSLYDKDGGANLRSLQSCWIGGVCLDSNNATFYSDDPEALVVRNMVARWI